MAFSYFSKNFCAKLKAMREYKCYVCERDGKDDEWDAPLRLGSCRDCGFFYCVSKDDDDVKTGCFYSDCHDLCSGMLEHDGYHLVDENCPHWPEHIPKDERKLFAKFIGVVVKAHFDGKLPGETPPQA